MNNQEHNSLIKALGDLVFIGDILSPDIIFIDFGPGPVWHYKASGIGNLVVRGGLTSSDHSDSWFSFVDLNALHNKIADRLLSKNQISGTSVRFLRKEMLLTQEELSICLGVNLDVCDKWEEEGDDRLGIETGLRRLYLNYRSTGLRPAIEPIPVELGLP